MTSLPLTDVTLPPDTRSPWQARRFVTDVLADEASEPVASTVALLVSEMVTNAVLHARTEITVSVEYQGDWLRVEVADSSPVGPTVRNFTTQAATGRGLQLVEELADRWGTEPSPDGKVVWFEVDVTDG